MSVFDTDNQSFNSSPELLNCFENSLHTDSGLFFFVCFSVVVVPLHFVCKKSV